MNVNFKSSVGQGKSLFFGKSNDGKKTLFKNIPLPPTPVDLYINNIENIDGQALEENVKQSIRNFVSGCQQDNIWDSIKSCCILAGARTLSGALVPLKGAAPTNFNFISSDYSRVSGLKGNASSKYLNSNRSNLIDPLDSHHISIYIVETGSNSNNQCLIGSSFNSSTSITTNFGQGAKFLNNRSNSSFTTYQGANSGFRGVSRNNSSNFIYYISPSTTGVTNSNSATPNSLDYSVFSLSYDDIAFSPRQLQYTDARISFYSIGESIDLNLLQSRVNTLMNDFQQMSSLPSSSSSSSSSSLPEEILENNILVTNAGADSINGEYDFIGIINNKPYYNKLFNFILWDNGWLMYDFEFESEPIYSSNQNVLHPWQVTNWTTFNPGYNPTPVVTQVV